jgi:ABC-type maltose transport system permease subunit
MTEFVCILFVFVALVFPLIYLFLASITTKENAIENTVIIGRNIKLLFEYKTRLENRLYFFNERTSDKRKKPDAIIINIPRRRARTSGSAGY